MPGPTNLEATAIDDDSISLTWDAYEGAVSYDIERDSVIIVTDHPTTSYTDTGLDPGTAYDYRVRAKLGGPVFNPETDITWHSLFWTEGTAFTALGLADTDAVTTWPNETGESDATQGTGSLQPAYDASHASFNDKPVVTFAGDSLTSAAFSVNPSYASGVSFVVIAKANSGDANSAAVDGITSGSSNRLALSNSSTGQYSIFAGTQRNSAVASDADKHLWVAKFDGSTGTDTLAIDAVNVVTNTAGSETITGITIGNDQGGFQPWGGEIAFVGVYEGDITADTNYGPFLDWCHEHYDLATSGQMVGGVVTYPGDGYVYHTFTTSGTLAPIGDPVEVEYLVVAGGGGAPGDATGQSIGGGGGGAGDFKPGTATIASAQTVTVGAGGAAANNANASNGSASSLGAISALGGGGGGYSGDGLSGGSGGGGGSDTTAVAHSGGTATGDGFAGGASTATAGSDNAAGGGGGAGEVGEAGVGNNGGDGGDGLQWPAASGTNYAGGGAGGHRSTTTPGGAGGLGGGGDGGYSGVGGTAGDPNTGGGGGGGSRFVGGNAGGSGITIVRYPIDYAWSGAITDPSDLIGLEHWIDPSDASTLTKSGDAVTALTDKSPNAYSATITGTLLHNSTAKGVINGLAAFQAELTGELFTVPISGVTTDVTVFAVVKPHTSSGQLFDIRDASDAVPLHDDGATGGRRGRRRNNANTLVSTTGTGTFTFDTPHIYTYAAHSTLIQFWMNGANGDTSSIAVSGTVNGLDKVDYLKGCNGGFGEFVIYRRFMEAAERLLVEQYLASKWGVTLA